MNTNIKSGLYSTELYVTIASMVVSILVTHGIVSATNVDAVTNAIITLLGIIVPAIVYTMSRTWLKAKMPPAQPGTTIIEQKV